MTTAGVNGESSVLAEARAQAVEHGRALGEQEARSRGETGEVRVKRAMAYAAWEFDSSALAADAEPLDFHLYREEFGLAERALTPSLERAPLRLQGGSAEKKERK